MSKKILIIINGGVAQLEYKPDDVELEIRDYDVECIDVENDERCKQDKDDDWYQESIYEAEIEPEIVPEEDGNKNITLIQHNISYYFDDNSEIDDYESEHIVYMIEQGYGEGELNKGKDEIRGWWKIVK